MDMAETCLALAGHKSGLASVAFSPDSRCVASASHDDIIRAWNARNGKPVLVLRGHNGLVNSVAFSPDGSRIASGSCDKTAMLWDAATGDPVLKLEGHAHWVFAVAFSPDGRRLATASADRTAAVWDPESAEILFRLKGHKDSVRAVAYSPNGRWIVTGGAFDGGVRLWKSSDGRAILRMEVGNEGIHAVSFSRDSRSLAVASDSRAGSVWDVLSGKQQYPLLGHTGDVLGVAFSPDGRSLGTASQDGTARVWSPQFGHCRLTLAGHKSKVWGIAFSRDNSRIATVSADGTTMLWDGHSGARMLTLCKDSDARRIGRSLAIEDSRKDLASVEGSGNLAGRPGTAIDLPIAAVSGETETERELRRQLQQREDEMRSMQEELHRLRKGGAGVSGSIAGPPDDSHCELMTGNFDSDCIQIEFPYELNSTDYLQRALAHVTFTLRPLYEMSILHGGCTKVRDGRYDEHVEPEDAQCRHLTQHLIENVDYYAQRKVLNYEHPGELLELAKRLQAAQNDLAAAELSERRALDPAFVVAVIYWARELATAARMPFAIENLTDLLKRFRRHEDSKRERRR